MNRTTAVLLPQQQWSVGSIRSLIVPATVKPKTTKTKALKGDPKVKRQPTAYNLFMKDEITRVKQADPGLKHQEAFKRAAGNWKLSPHNPKKPITLHSPQE